MLITMISLISSSVLANEKTVINQSPKTSVMTAMALHLQDSIGHAEFYQSRDCRDAALTYQKNAESVIIYETMNVASAAAKKIDCEINFRPADVVLAAVQHFQFCRLPDRKLPIKSMRTLGMSGMHPYKKWINELNASNGMNVNVSVYQGSEATLRGIISREIDFGFVADATAVRAQQQGLIQCDYSTNPNDDNFIGRHLAHSIPDLAIRVFVLSRRDQDALRTRLRTHDFHGYLEKSGYTSSDASFSQKQFETYRREFNLLKSFY